MPVYNLLPCSAYSFEWHGSQAAQTEAQLHSRASSAEQALQDAVAEVQEAQAANNAAKAAAAQKYEQLRDEYG